MADDSDLKPWADELQRLLQLAAQARQSGDMARVVDVQKRLGQFCDDSPPLAEPLDRQARAAIFDLDLDGTEQAVESIRQRADEVRALGKLIAGIGSQAKARADVLNGTLALQAIDAATSAINAFKQLRADLGAVDTADADLTAVATSIDKTLAAVQGLRNRLEKG